MIRPRKDVDDILVEFARPDDLHGAQTQVAASRRDLTRDGAPVDGAQGADIVKHDGRTTAL
ncbi:hypothetical protein AB4Z10_13240 [Bosea sp. RAF48]|uniref:hypothetical protein n=1 Tax=Bosea sp. RAF48 TaxID=3237480 RepID=UPI003F8E1315